MIAPMVITADRVANKAKNALLELLGPKMTGNDTGKNLTKAA
jgi:hypothetical protein